VALRALLIAIALLSQVPFAAAAAGNSSFASHNDDGFASSLTPSALHFRTPGTLTPRTPSPTLFAYSSYQRPPAWKAPLRTTLGLLALASFGTAVYFDIDADKRAKEQRDITAAYMAAPEGSDFEAYKTEWRSKNDGIDQASITANICWSAGAALTLGWVWLYAF